MERVRRERVASLSSREVIVLKRTLATAALFGAVIAGGIAPAAHADGVPPTQPGNSGTAPGQTKPAEPTEEEKEAAKSCENKKVKYYLDLVQAPLDQFVCLRALKK